MNREAMMRRIQALGFTLWELHLYLDTHYNDAQALEKAKETEEKLNTYTAEYESQFGPLSYNMDNGSACGWLKDPWPWD